MNKEDFFAKYVQPKTAVHCATEELANELLKKANEYELHWSSGKSYIEINYWYDEKDKTCYYLYGGSYQNIIVYEMLNYNIIEFNGFEETTADNTGGYTSGKSPLENLEIIMYQNTKQKYVGEVDQAYEELKKFILESLMEEKKDE